MSTDIRILRSATPSLRPLVSDLESGQPMANIESSDPGLYFRLDNDQLMKVGPSHVGPEAPNSLANTGGSSGNSQGESWLDTTDPSSPLFKIYSNGEWIIASSIGDKGEIGKKGEKGEKGERGDKFIYQDFTPDELEGLKGSKGSDGSSGTGTKGSKGEPGIGTQGPKGEKGLKGVDGDSGTGTKGSKGEKGDKFIFSDFTQPELDSLKGEKGFKGTAGTGGKGEKGEVGPKGEKGDGSAIPNMGIGELNDVNVILPDDRDRLVYHQQSGNWVSEAQFPNPDTGWSSPTGTSSKAAFATDSVTTEELAERVKAIIEALDAAGLIDS